MGCLLCKNNNKIEKYDYNPLSIEDEIHPYRDLQLSRYFNIWVPFETREEKISHIFYRSYPKAPPKEFYVL